MLIISSSIFCLFIFASTVTHIILQLQHKQSITLIIKTEPIAILVSIICFFTIWSLLGLAGFHTYLISTNQTTHEDVRGMFDRRTVAPVTNPYSTKSYIGNCFVLLCGPNHPSLIRRREFIEEEEAF